MKRKDILRDIWNQQDKAFELMMEYDELPHHYGSEILYQAEGHIIDLIAAYPDITVTDLSNILRKTSSACSQMVRKLREKGLVEQTRNRDNNRLYNLRLTTAGQQVFRDHMEFNRQCQDITFSMLDSFSDEELAAHLRVQKRINEAYMGDVQRSRERFLQYKETGE